MMSPAAKRGINLFGAWSGVIYMFFVVLGWGIVAGFLPPHPPSAGADDIAQIIQDNPFRIRLGMVIAMFGAFFCIPFTGVLAQYVARIEGGPGILTYSTVMSGIGNTVLTFYPMIFWLTAAYRLERAPELMLVLNDWAWLQLIGGATMFWMLPLSMAIAALCDKSETPVFPRWSGYAAIWMFFAILPDQLLFFFKIGPFAWNGVFGIWVPLMAFGGWFGMVSYLMIRALNKGVLPESAPRLKPGERW